MSDAHTNTFLYPDSQIIVFAREPVLGQVKTRLIPALGIEGATQLYTQLLDHTIDKVLQSQLCPVDICITPESNKEYFLRNNQLDFLQVSWQCPGDLGQKMVDAIAKALKNYSSVILIGSDCPLLNIDDLQQAIIALQENDMVFSPASDGGYVLVGAKSISPLVFENICWGSEIVMQQTRQVLIDNHISWEELSEQHDIDVQDDLKYLPEHLMPSP